MILYHGSTVKVEHPNYNLCRTDTDFGKGFYTITCKEQAVKWAKLKQQRAEKGHAVVSVYEVDDNLFEPTELFNTLRFTGADKEWLDFVFSNRKGIQTKQYDIVFGPVANDRLYATITLYEQGILSAEAAIEQLKSYLLFDQVSFNSQQGINQLRFTGSEIIPE